VFRDGAAKAMHSLTVEIVKRSDRVKGFAVEPKRWIVERSIAWLNRCRRLAKDWENRNHNALAFLRLASIRLMLRKLCNPLRSLRTDSEASDGRRCRDGRILFVEQRQAGQRRGSAHRSPSDLGYGIGRAL